MLGDLLLGNYKTVANRLDLTVEGGQIHGVVQTVPLRIWFGPHATHIAALLSHPSQVELSLAAKGLVGKLTDFFGGHSGGIGDPEFDHEFSAKASDLSRVAALVDPDARKALLDAAKAGLHPAVDAHSVHLRRFSQGGLADSERMIESDIYCAAQLARVIGASFQRSSA